MYITCLFAGALQIDVLGIVLTRLHIALDGVEERIYLLHDVCRNSRLKTREEQDQRLDLLLEFSELAGRLAQDIDDFIL